MNRCALFWGLLLWQILHLYPGSAQESSHYDTRFTRPLREVLDQIEERFDLQIECRRFSPDTLRLPYADFRLRPYSAEESLEGICAPLDLKWSRRAEGRYRLEPYEYYRRTPAEGERLLAWLSTLYADRETWEQRREVLLREARAILDMQPLYDSLVEEPRVVWGEQRSFDGYTTRSYALETLPGVFVGGTIYAPADGRQERHPLILAPAGHWEGGRLREDQQLRMATLARMGAVAVDLDIVGWGSCAGTVAFAHEDPRSMRLQVLWSRAVADWVIRTRTDIDTSRLAATGGSGGATHSLLLALEDPRFRILAPVAHLTAHFDGGCPCESAVPVTLAAGGTCMTELLAAVAAPNPLLVVSNGGDWTHTFPTSEYPFLRRIWSLYGAEERVENQHFPEERHRYGAPQRQAVYGFLARVLGLDLRRADEGCVQVQSPGELEVVLPDE